MKDSAQDYSSDTTLDRSVERNDWTVPTSFSPECADDIIGEDAAGKGRSLLTEVQKSKCLNSRALSSPNGMFN